MPVVKQILRCYLSECNSFMIKNTWIKMRKVDTMGFMTD